MSDLAVSVVIPAHDEEPTIAAVVRGAAAHTPGLLEVIVVDDGSTDGTAAAAASAGARVLRTGVQVGKGRALRTGFSAARGDVLVAIDGDAQDDPAQIGDLLAALTPETDLVLGSRFLGHFGPGAISHWNRIGTRFLTRTTNLLFGAHLTDPLAGFRAFRRSLLARIDLDADGYDIEIDLVARVLRAGGRIAEVPVRREARRFGSSGLSSLRDGTRILARLLRLRFEPTARRIR